MTQETDTKPKEGYTPQADGTKLSTSFTVKTILLCIFALLLLIPLGLVHNLISTRKYEGENVKKEITMRWGQSQNIYSPVLVIPYTPDGINATESQIHLLPSQVDATAELDIENRYRGIYDVPIYTANTNIKGSWLAEDIRQALSEIKGKYDLSRAKITTSISDPTGYQGLLYIDVNGKRYKMKSDPKSEAITVIEYGYNETPSLVLLRNSIDTHDDSSAGARSTFFPLAKDSLTDLVFNLDLKIGGSENFGILANAYQAHTSISGNWSDPSFQGKKLPTDYQIEVDHFNANWETFMEEAYVTDEGLSTLLSNGYFVKLTNSVDHYAKTERSTKYGILIIALTLLSLYIVDLFIRRKGKSINLLHYILTGLSLILFYALLLSFCEIIGFEWAYLLASAMTITLNTIYFHKILKERRTALLLGGIMTLLYLIIFVLMQLKLYALLTGSLALFVILAIVMYISTKVIRE